MATLLLLTALAAANTQVWEPIRTHALRDAKSRASEVGVSLKKTLSPHRYLLLCPGTHSFYLLRPRHWKKKTLFTSLLQKKQLKFCQGQFQHPAEIGQDGENADFPGSPMVKDSALQIQGAQFRSLIKELDPTCCNSKILHAAMKAQCSQTNTFL